MLDLTGHGPHVLGPPESNREGGCACYFFIELEPKRMCESGRLLAQVAALVHDGQLITVGILEKRHPQLVIT
jgi:hypothetical protein